MTNGTGDVFERVQLVVTTEYRLPTVADRSFTASGAFSNTKLRKELLSPANFQVFTGEQVRSALKSGAATCARVVLRSQCAHFEHQEVPRGTAASSAATVDDTNGAAIYYDTQLQNVHIGGIVATVQPSMMDSFSWARF